MPMFSFSVFIFQCHSLKYQNEAPLFQLHGFSLENEMKFKKKENISLAFTASASVLSVHIDQSFHKGGHMAPSSMFLQFFSFPSEMAHTSFKPCFRAYATIINEASYHKMRFID